MVSFCDQLVSIVGASSQHQLLIQMTSPRKLQGLVWCKLPEMFLVWRWHLTCDSCSFLNFIYPFGSLINITCRLSTFQSFQVYSYRFEQYIQVLMAVINNSVVHNQKMLSLRLLHSACRFNQELKAVAGGKMQLVKVSKTYLYSLQATLLCIIFHQNIFAQWKNANV